MKMSYEPKTTCYHNMTPSKVYDVKSFTRTCYIVVNDEGYRIALQHQHFRHLSLKERINYIFKMEVK